MSELDFYKFWIMLAPILITLLGIIIWVVLKYKYKKKEIPMELIKEIKEKGPDYLDNLDEGHPYSEETINNARKILDSGKFAARQLEQVGFNYEANKMFGLKNPWGDDERVSSEEGWK